MRSVHVTLGNIPLYCGEGRQQIIPAYLDDLETEFELTEDGTLAAVVVRDFETDKREFRVTKANAIAGLERGVWWAANLRMIEDRNAILDEAGLLPEPEPPEYIPIYGVTNGRGRVIA